MTVAQQEGGGRAFEPGAGGGDQEEDQEGQEREPGAEQDVGASKTESPSAGEAVLSPLAQSVSWRPRMTMRAPADRPWTAPSYIISALAGGWMKVPSVVARVRK
jgi:hypothetical protein